MNTFLWAVQVALALKWLSVAFTHGLRLDRPGMQHGRRRLGGAARPRLVGAALGALAGAAAQVLPGIVGGVGWLAPWSAAFLAVLMLVGIVLHLGCRPTPKVWAGTALIVLGALVAVGRWVLAPL